MPPLPPPTPPPVSSTGVERDAAAEQIRKRNRELYSYEDTILSPNSGLKRTLG